MRGQGTRIKSFLQSYNGCSHGGANAARKLASYLDLCSIGVVIYEHVCMNSVTYGVAMIGGFLFL